MQYRDAPGHPGRGPAYTLDRYRTADDRAVEAMLASVREPCTVVPVRFAEIVRWPAWPNWIVFPLMPSPKPLSVRVNWLGPNVNWLP